MQTYAEYLQSLGASAEDVKLMDTPVARRAYDALQKQAADALAEAERQKAGADAYHVKVDDWFKTHDAEFKTVEQQLIAARAKAASFESALRTINDRGIIDVTKDLGLNLDAPAPAAKKDEPVAIDTSKFVTTDAVLQLAEREAESIAMMSDIAAEHVYLFGAPLRNARELRKEATTRKVSLEQVWMEKYKVPEARTAKEAATAKAAEDTLRAKITEEVTAKLASQYGNPDLRPLEPSRSFLIPNKDRGRDKAPWELGTDGDSGSNDRVRRATANAMKAGVH
jgi:hypothetical protein